MVYNNNNKNNSNNINDDSVDDDDDEDDSDVDDNDDHNTRVRLDSTMLYADNDDSISFEDDIDFEYDENLTTTTPTFNYGTVPTLVTTPPPLPTPSGVLFSKLLRLLNANVIIYNANIKIYKEVATTLEAEFYRVTHGLISNYFGVCSFIATIILADISNSVSRSYDNLLSYIRTTLTAYALNLFNRTKDIRIYLAETEKTLKIHGRILTRLFLLISHLYDYGSFGMEFSIHAVGATAIASATTDGNSEFVQAISDGFEYIYYKVVKKIRQKFENIYWLHSYLHACKNTKYLAIYLRSQLV